MKCHKYIFHKIILIKLLLMNTRVFSLRQQKNNIFHRQHNILDIVRTSFLSFCLQYWFGVDVSLDLEVGQGRAFLIREQNKKHDIISRFMLGICRPLNKKQGTRAAVHLFVDAEFRFANGRKILVPSRLVRLGPELRKAGDESARPG